MLLCCNELHRDGEGGADSKGWFKRWEGGKLKSSVERSESGARGETPPPR